ncbi:MAG: endonuclease/exonuclease/phosphatase family protein [Elusimicrobia bacterium]|nr:endonuclease/exonuclease/phosphatase family protein [Elusimicrobiota bacterium]
MAPLILLLAASLVGAAETPAKVIKAVTFNAAGIPLVHPRLAARLQGCGKAIAVGGFDLAGLQELWRDKDSAALAAASGLPHAARFHRRLAFRTGLTILSRWPIVRTEERAFTVVRPSLRHLAQGELVAGKGYLFARVGSPWGELDVYAAHTLADYPETRYHLLRLTELFELAEGVLELSAGRPFVILGDLNSGHGDREYDLFLDLLGLSDPCAPAGVEACGDPRRPKRIDHALVPGRLAASAARVFDDSLSDHYGFAVELPRALMSLRAQPDPKRRAAALRAVEDETSEAIERLEAEGRRASWVPLYGTFVSARYARQAARLRAIRERAASARR